MTELDQWCSEAVELGREHARNAASWITDGNDSDGSRRRKLRMLEEGDPEIDSWLPGYPNLSGEWADGPTPQSLAREIAALDIIDVDDEAEVVAAIADAYERGVDEEFLPACEAELRRWIDG